MNGQVYHKVIFYLSKIATRTSIGSAKNQVVNIDKAREIG